MKRLDVSRKLEFPTEVVQRFGVRGGPVEGPIVQAYSAPQTHHQRCGLSLNSISRQQTVGSLLYPNDRSRMQGLRQLGRISPAGVKSTSPSSIAHSIPNQCNNGPMRRRSCSGSDVHRRVRRAIHAADKAGQRHVTSDSRRPCIGSRARLAHPPAVVLAVVFRIRSASAGSSRHPRR